METSEILAHFHQRVVNEFIESVLEEVACDMGNVERNILGVALRQEVETRLVPGLLAIHALLLGADARTLGRIPEWLDRVQIPLPSEAEFLTEMGLQLDPVGSALLAANSDLRRGESETSQTFRDCLWELVPFGKGPSL